MQVHQTETGVKVPQILQQFMPDEYKEEIPFVKPAPIDVEQAKPKKKGK